MRRIALIAFFCLCCGLGWAHEPNEAFFRLTQKEETIEIEAEFPWTMRNALIAFNPALQNSTDRKDFEDTFVDYIKANLVLKDGNGVLFQYQEFRALEANGHSHQNNYLIVFKGYGPVEVTNTMMFNVYENQVNHHVIEVNSRMESFVTTARLPSFRLSKQDNQKRWFLLALLLPVAYVAYRVGNRKPITPNGVR